MQIMEEEDEKSRFLEINPIFYNIPTYKIDKKYEINEPPILDESEIDKDYDLRYDIIEKIIYGRLDKSTKVFRVRFRKRASGYQPPDAELEIDEIKKWAPIVLVEYYESKLLSFNPKQNDSNSDINSESEFIEITSDDEEDENSD